MNAIKTTLFFLITGTILQLNGVAIFIKTGDNEHRCNEWHKEDSQGNTIFHYLVFQPKSQHKKIIATINVIPKKDLEKLINKSNKSGQTPLELAIRCEKIELVKFLLDKKCSITSKNKNNETCLHLAARLPFTSTIPILSFLIERVKKDAPHLFCEKNRSGFNAMELALSLANNPGARLLAKAYTPPLKISYVPTLNTVKEYQIPFEIEDDNNNNLLHLALQHENQAEAIKMLVYAFNNGGNRFTTLVNKKNKNGLTPLYCAIIKQNLPATKLLLEKGAEITSVNSKLNQNCLHAAILTNSSEIISFIINYAQGNKINKLFTWRNELKQTPAQLAFEQGRFEILELLKPYSPPLEISPQKLAQSRTSRILERMLNENGAQAIVKSDEGYKRVKNIIKQNFKENTRLLKGPKFNAAVKNVINNIITGQRLKTSQLPKTESILAFLYNNFPEEFSAVVSNTFGLCTFLQEKCNVKGTAATELFYKTLQQEIIALLAQELRAKNRLLANTRLKETDRLPWQITNSQASRPERL